MWRMYLNKKEMRIVKDALYMYLQVVTGNIAFGGIIYGIESLRKEEKKVEEARNLFRQLIKKLRIKLSEEQYLMLGLIERVSREKIEYWANQLTPEIFENVPTGISTIAYYYLKKFILKNEARE
jgi:Fe-S cluster assembly scaffold protein SufB